MPARFTKLGFSVVFPWAELVSSGAQEYQQAEAAGLLPHTNLGVFYWQAAVLAEKAGDKPTAVLYYRKILDKAAFSGYAYQAQLRLRALVGRMALAAAFEDPRFEKVRAGELKDIDVEISVLTPFKDVAGPGAIVVGRDGVLLQKGGRSAVFLPQVAVEEHWTRDQMLDNLCLKGGLDADCWHAGAKLSTFQADVFKEGDFR